MTNRSKPIAAVAPTFENRAFLRLALHLLLLLAIASLVACGGSSGSPTDPIVMDTASVASQSFELINSARADHGVGSLTFDPELSRIARKHSEAMRDRGFFAHRDPEGNGLRSRLRANGVTFSAAGENLALVSDTGNPAGVAHQQLLASTEHRDVMLAGRFARAGVGVAQAGDSFWITQIFLKP